MSNSTGYAPGTTVRFVTQYGTPSGGFKPGDVVVVTSCRKTLSAGFQVRVARPAEFASPDPVIESGAEYGSDWFERTDGIPFSLTKETSKRYAALSNSRKLDEDQRKVLDDAAKGKEVDVWAFHTAVTAALSLAATRAGQSMGRREYTKMARHLLYISGAVIANSLAGLPPIEPGTRSPKIAQQDQEIADLRATVKRMAVDVQRSADALEAEQAKHAETAVEKIEVERAWKRLAESGRNQRKQFDYALSLLDDESKFKVVGFGDAVSWLSE